MHSNLHTMTTGVWAGCLAMLWVSACLVLNTARYSSAAVHTGGHELEYEFTSCVSGVEQLVPDICPHRHLPLVRVYGYSLIKK